MLSTTIHEPARPAEPSADERSTARGVEALYATGYWLHSQERCRDAMCVFRAMILWAPNDERGYLALGACHESLEQPEIALDIYGAATIAAPRAARSHLARARLLRAAGRDDEAREALDTADDLTDDDDLRDLIRAEGARS